MQQELNRTSCSSAALSYVDAELSRGAAKRPAGRQGFGDVLQGEDGGQNPHGEPDHQEACGASEGPAVPWMDVRLQEDRDGAGVELLLRLHPYLMDH